MAEYYQAVPDGVIGDRFGVKHSDFISPEYQTLEQINPKKWEECRGLGKALARYSAAWVLNPADSEAAVCSAAILRDHANSVDPNGTLFGQLLETLFQQEGQAYFENDWPNILRFHVVLGTIFERDKVWGSSNNPQSAIFLWESALRAESQVRQIDKTSPPSPGIHASLSLAYQNISRIADTWDQYILAAQGFIQTHNPDPATVALDSAESLLLAPSADR